MTMEPVEAVLDQLHQRRYDAWYHHMTLAKLAYACLRATKDR
jgi:hypothetical protein